jgi:hypothetical protein
MRKTHLIFLAAFIVCTACTTLDQSFKLGGTTGALTGAAAVYSAGSMSGRTPTIEEVGTGAAIGMGLGLLTSYLIHHQVAAEREESARQTEIYFGDLPPSPFVIPGLNSHKGGR